MLENCHKLLAKIDNNGTVIIPNGLEAMKITLQSIKPSENDEIRTNLMYDSKNGVKECHKVYTRLFLARREAILNII